MEELMTYTQFIKHCREFFWKFLTLIPILGFLYVIIAFIPMSIWITTILMIVNTYFIVKTICWAHNMYLGMKMSEEDYNEVIENLNK